MKKVVLKDIVHVTMGFITKVFNNYHILVDALESTIGFRRVIK